MKVPPSPRKARRRTQTMSKAAPPPVSRFANLIRGKRPRTAARPRPDTSPTLKTAYCPSRAGHDSPLETETRLTADREEQGLDGLDLRDSNHEHPLDHGHTPAYLDSNGAILPALFPPVGGSPPTAPAAGTGPERAQAAALAERLLQSMHVGEISGGHEVRMRLAGGDIEVQLQEVNGVLRPTLIGEGDLGPLARRLEREFRRRGLRFDRVELSS